ncbi:MAG: beta-ketoacyl-ACP synthase II [Planctomycetota bacterium]
MSEHNGAPRRVLITGIGAVTNLGGTAPTTWDAMVSGRSGITRFGDTYPGFAKWTEDHWASRVTGEIHDLTPAAALSPREVKKLDRFAVLGITAGIEAVGDSGLDFASDQIERERCGVIIGSGIGGMLTIEDGHAVLAERKPDRMNPFTVPKLMANAVTGDLSIRYGLEGHSGSHTTACASSGHSIAEAHQLIRRGRADVMIAGGAEGCICSLTLAAFMTMKALSTRNDDPQKASRPFDKDRDGFVLAEGAAVFVLESESHARARGATIYGELLGAAASSDATHITAPDAEGRGAKRAMRWALEEAGCNATDIDYINAHGTSTPLGDAAEVHAALGLFGDHARSSAGGTLLMSSTKSMTGHCLGASGAVELVACLGAIRHGVIPPTINLDQPDDEFDIDLVPNTAREQTVRYAMNNTFGFGGHNVSMVVGADRG